MTLQRRRRRPRTVLAALALLLVSSACASRVPHEEHLAMVAGNARDQEAAADGGSGSDGGTGSLAPGVTGEGTDGVVVGGGTTTGGTTTGGTGATGGTSGPAAASGGAAIRVGMIGNFGGVAGASFVSARESLKAWVGMVNAKGGINGHRVELLVADDGNEGTRDLGIAKDFVENRGVVALINYFGAAGGPEAVAKLRRGQGRADHRRRGLRRDVLPPPEHVPPDHGARELLLLERQGHEGRGHDQGGDRLLHRGRRLQGERGRVQEVRARRWACRSSTRPGCRWPSRTSPPSASTPGPPGPTRFYPQVDGNSVTRLARSCTRQGFQPRLFMTAPVDPPDPLVEGAIATLRSFPWFIESGSPALEEYGQAMRTYAPNLTRNSFTTYGWMSGKLLEKAAAHVSTQPTSREILEGLWAIHDETFGGISPAISFAEGKPAPKANCTFYAEVKGGKWVAPRGMELVACM